MGTTLGTFKALPFSGTASALALEGASVLSAAELRRVRGLLPSERRGMGFLDPHVALVAVTAPAPSVRLGALATLEGDVRWATGRAPKATPLVGELAVQRLLHGTSADGHAHEDGPIVEGIMVQIRRIRDFDDLVISATIQAGRDYAVQGVRAAARTMRGDLPVLIKVANGIRANLGNKHSPVIVAVANSVHEKLVALQEELVALDLDSVSYKALAHVFDWLFLTGATLADQTEGAVTPTIRFGADPFLHDTALTVLNYLHEHGVMSQGETGDGLTITFPLNDDDWRSDDTFTRAEFEALLRLLGWSVTTRRASDLGIIFGAAVPAAHEDHLTIHLSFGSTPDQAQ